jgi:uncharacterized protein with FMN-binding domain
VSTRAKFAAVIASAGVLGAGWAAGTANGATVATTTTTGTTATTATTSGTTTKTTNTSGSTTYKDGTYTGTAVQHRYGAVTVSVTIAGGKITNVSAQADSAGDRRSSSINSQAVPMMKTEVLSANSANVSTVSGATYTTTAYITSLQSALAKA